MKFLKDNRSFIVFLLCFGLFRTAIADWNPIPSGSMRPTLLEGDVVLVNRLAYDLKLPLTDVRLLPLGEPQRGDVVTFSSPLDGTRLIKRVVALAGDVVEMRQQRLRINGEWATYSSPTTQRELVQPGLSAEVERSHEAIAGRTHALQWIPAAHTASARRDFGPVTVPADHYFMLGDNRDNSFDSRYIGFVPRALLIGRAHHIVASADMLGNWMPRLERVAAAIR
jgi:signal peptidase I